MESLEKKHSHIEADILAHEVSLSHKTTHIQAIVDLGRGSLHTFNKCSLCC